ncbi:hypothetical protein NY2A_B546L [Paramecium bursaria Chlorella virus NY2A]|uniref:Uncharacterized protein B546L n=1 Tax=Paramecium bursaria Chlorella virus NY2A TaxID=46021 RepID=A7IX71_PBCVN|nr:hypothetical protein NY2A_B546L [Paramecium bursaria Chlorella virus NY2A]ABT14945.1 hypothetical protein NY2A_B546L [Paramecium bursaria Chlorella virus NY2A]
MNKINDLEQKFSVPMNQPLLNNFLNNTTSWCRLNPIGCGKQAAIETLFLIMAYSSIIFLVGGQVPYMSNILKFAIVFFLFSVAARMISDSFSDKLGIAALSGIGLKAVSLIAPRVVSW